MKKIQRTLPLIDNFNLQRTSISISVRQVISFPFVAMKNAEKTCFCWAFFRVKLKSSSDIILNRELDLVVVLWKINKLLIQLDRIIFRYYFQSKYGIQMGKCTDFMSIGMNQKCYSVNKFLLTSYVIRIKY